MKKNRKNVLHYNKYMIFPYVIYLLKLYDDICLFIINKQMKYESDSKNLEIIKRITRMI